MGNVHPSDEHDVAEASRNVVTNNYIQDGGHVYAVGVGLWLAQSSHNTISHNEIHSFDYSGISLGWTWSEAPNRTHNNTIEYNYVHHVVCLWKITSCTTHSPAG